MKRLVLLFSTMFLLNCAGVFPTNSTSSQPKIVDESAEFAQLIEKDKLTRGERSAAVVNMLLNEKPTDKKAALMFENNSDCNIIIRIVGNTDYDLPIEKHGKNFLIVDKGEYIFRSTICTSKYYDQKSVQHSLSIALANK